MPRDVYVRLGYVEFVYRGEVDAASVEASGPLPEEVLSAIRDHHRVLFDFSAVESFGFDVYALGEAMKRGGVVDCFQGMSGET